MSSLTVLSPVGINRVESRPISPRVPTLKGLNLGLLNNNKPNAARLLDEVAALLNKAHALGELKVRQKPHSSVGVEDVAGYANEVQAALVAVGD